MDDVWKCSLWVVSRDGPGRYGRAGREPAWKSPHSPQSPRRSWPLSQQFPGLASDGCSPLGERKVEGFPFPSPCHHYSGEIGLEVFTRNLGDSLRREWGD